MKKLPYLISILIFIASSQSFGKNNKKIPDTTPPKIELIGENPTILYLHEQYKEMGAKVTDNQDKNPLLQIKGKINSNKSGKFIIKYIAIDKAGNKKVKKRIVKIINPNNISLQKAKEIFYQRAKKYNFSNSYKNLINSYLIYAHKKAKNEYSFYINQPLNYNIWNFIEKNPDIKEGLYASSFPTNPYVIKNLADFLSQWEKEGKKSAFIQKYKNVALGLSINAKERGIFSEAFFGDIQDHLVVNYKLIPKIEEKKNRWLHYFDFKNLGYNISKKEFIKLLTIRYHLTQSEKEYLKRKSHLKKALNDGYEIEDIDLKVRKKYKIAFDELNLYRVLSNQPRLNCYEEGNPCAKIEKYLQKHSDISKSDFLAHFSKYKKKLGLIRANNKMAIELAGYLGIWPDDQKEYRLMSFYDLAKLKIANDNIAPIDFKDNEINWPIFHFSLNKLPWQILALEQSAQKKECTYVKKRFFETDKEALRQNYPPHAIDGGKKATKRFIQYTTYTWDFKRAEVLFRKSNWNPKKSIYRILQDGGACGRQSTMAQHLNECLNRPSIGVGQPKHRAWVGVYADKTNSKRLFIKIGYKKGSLESVTTFSNTLYNQYTSKIRKKGLERFAHLVAGVSPANGGVHRYNQSMILQHIAYLMEKEKSNNVELLLKKAIEIMPLNADAWYQLTLYYAKNNKPEKILKLAQKYMQNRYNFFTEEKNPKGANDLALITGKNIAFAMLLTPSINNAQGEKALWAKEKLWNFLNRYEANKRSIYTYQKQNIFLANYYLKNRNDLDAFIEEASNLFKKFLYDNATGNYEEYFKDVDFKGSKKELFNKLKEMVDNAQISKRKKKKIYEKILHIPYR